MTFIRPSVMVPVLSKRTVPTELVLSRISAFRMRSPAWAPFPEDTMMATGVASPRAHGQAMTRTETAKLKDVSKSPVAMIQPEKTRRLRRMTAGTKYREMRSARREIGAFESEASFTRRMICSMEVSSPTFSASTSR